MDGAYLERASPQRPKLSVDHAFSEYSERLAHTSPTGSKLDVFTSVFACVVMTPDPK